MVSPAPRVGCWLRKAVRMGFKPLWIVPVFRHTACVRTLVPRLRASGVPVLLIDDGNNPALGEVPGAEVLRLERNCGKGAAIVAGVRWAAAREFTAVAQIDADGQHNIEDALAMLRRAESLPETLLSGFPVYDASVPKARSKGREVTRFFLRLEMGLTGEDGLCGCRVYPLGPLMRVLPKVRSRRMGFDPEVIVRWVWQGFALEPYPVRVTYPVNGVSNFRMVRDNLSFVLLHTRLLTLRVLRFLGGM